MEVDHQCKGSETVQENQETPCYTWEPFSSEGDEFRILELDGLHCEDRGEEVIYTSLRNVSHGYRGSYDDLSYSWRAPEATKNPPKVNLAPKEIAAQKMVLRGHRSGYYRVTLCKTRVIGVN